MNKQDISEIKKQYKIKDCGIARIAGCYVDCSKEIVTRFNEPFLSLDDEEIFKYLDIFKKGLSGKIGKNIRTLPMPDGDSKKLLSSIIYTSASSDIYLNTLYERIMECTMDRPDAFLILLMFNNYDIPNKNADNLKDGESYEVYSYISLYLCPMKLEKPGLAFKQEENNIVHKERRWCVEAPEFSFVYPSFEERSADYDKVTVYTKSANDAFDSLIKGILSCDLFVSVEEQKKLFAEIVEQAVAESGVSDHIETIKRLNETIQDQIEESNSSIELNADDLKEILKKNQLNSKVVDDLALDNTFTADIISSPDMEISMKGVKVKIKSEAKGKLQRQVIDGQEYIMIAVEGDCLTINGITVE